METKEQEQEQEKATKKRPEKGWWWTVIDREAKCESCSRELQPPRKVAYNNGSRKVYCFDCAQKEGVADLCKPSRKLQKMEKALKAEAEKAEKREVVESEETEVAEKEMAAAA